MKRFIALLLVAVLLVLPLAAADDSGTVNPNPDNNLRFTHFPQVYVNVSTNASFNVSYVGLIMVSTSGVFYSYFPADFWVVTRESNISVSYKSSIVMSHLDNQNIEDVRSQYNVTELNQSTDHITEQPEIENIPANVTVSMTKEYVKSPVNSTGNITNLTGFKISFSLTSSHIKGPGILYLIQALGAKIQNGYERYHVLAEVAQHNSVVNGSAIGVAGSGYNAYYWWSPNYTLNGHTANLTTLSSTIGNMEILIFKFPFKYGITSLVQDPYFSIPQVNLFSNPILQKDIQTAATFVILHIELFAAGLITGSILVGFSYVSYRRRRF